MRVVEILRISSSTSHGTRGVLTIDKLPFCVTLELPWRLNEPNRSCIPAGLYTCKRYKSDRYDDTFKVWGVYNRDSILFHPGNFLTDTDGCILPGRSFGSPGEKILIVQSRTAFFSFMRYLAADNSFYLSVSDVF